MPRLRRADTESLDGLEGHQFWKQFAAGGHEMAWHGATHLPLSDNTPNDAVDTELALAKRLGEALGMMPRSVIFPRNQIGHLDRLRGAGFDTYRASRGSGLANRVLDLVRELNAWDRGDTADPRFLGGWHVLPPGHFLNWPSGVRSLVPLNVTVRRWRSMLRNAAGCGGFVHMWFHPHNLITAPEMRHAFFMVMDEVGKLVKAGDIKNITMSETDKHFFSGKNHGI